MFWNTFNADTHQDTSEQLTLQEEMHKSLVLKSSKENHGGLGVAHTFILLYIALSKQSVDSCLEAAFLSVPHGTPVPWTPSVV